MNNNSPAISEKKELSTKKNINDEHELSVIEQVVMQGDLSKLSPVQRVTYYNKVCDSMGMNPYTRPFDYISLNGKLTLYAKKDATEQLRQVKKISIISLEGKMVDDLYIVIAKASTQDGRIDQATGAVSIANLKGEQKANAIMKAETKAKRRVTLSIGGMGWTDESEIDSIPNAQLVNVNLQTGEIIECQAALHSKEFIDSQDVKALEEALIADQDYRKKILDHYKVSCFEEIEKSQFMPIYNRMTQYLSKKNQIQIESSPSVFEVKE